jgi:tRNA nucleotidyltransferase (CCA-adding enzyme)
LFRRDFTVNAMAVALAPGAFGRLIDPFKGMADLKAKYLRILHPRSFVDDPSRILRAVRFAQRYHLTVEPRTRRALRRAVAAGMLERLNRGRWRKEFDRMTHEPRPLACLSLLAEWVRG